MMLFHNPKIAAFALFTATLVSHPASKSQTGVAAVGVSSQASEPTALTGDVIVYHALSRFTVVSLALQQSKGTPPNTILVLLPTRESADQDKIPQGTCKINLISKTMTVTGRFQAAHRDGANSPITSLYGALCHCLFQQGAIVGLRQCPKKIEYFFAETCSVR